MSDEEEVTRPPKIGKDPKSKGIKKDKDSCSLSVASLEKDSISCKDEMPIT